MLKKLLLVVCFILMGLGFSWLTALMDQSQSIPQFIAIPATLFFGALAAFFFFILLGATAIYLTLMVSKLFD
jgi:hypothetical protein